MLSKEERRFIVEQFTDKQYSWSEDEITKKCENPPYHFFAVTRNFTSCGDYIPFAVRENKEVIEEIYFAREEACLVAVAATNILCRWLMAQQGNKTALGALLFNIRQMINGQQYELKNCAEIKLFSKLRSFASKKTCLLLVVDSFSAIINKKEL